MIKALSLIALNIRQSVHNEDTEAAMECCAGLIDYIDVYME